MKNQSLPLPVSSLSMFFSPSAKTMFSEPEIKESIFNLDSDQALCPNGFPMVATMAPSNMLQARLRRHLFQELKEKKGLADRFCYRFPLEG